MPKMIFFNLRTGFQRFILPVLVVFSTGCSHTIKLYTGERSPQELAYVYTHISTLAVRYMDDKHLPIHSARDVLHITPGRHKFVVGNWFTTTFMTSGPYGLGPGYTSKWFLYEIFVDLKPGISYVPWTEDPHAPGTKEICFLAEPHDAPGAKFGTSSREHVRTPSKNAVKVACGKLIDANGYIAKHGGP